MRIAFDLDDTLIPAVRDTFPVEPPRAWLGRVFAPELMREGTSRLLRALRRHGCEVWVYTTSFRSPFHVRQLFLCYGVWIGGVINGDRHRRWLNAEGRRFSCSKYPPAFGIDLLIDDSEGVLMEARQYRYRMIHIRPDDREWDEKIVAEVNRSLTRPILLT
jgi:hypothetical protein